MPFGISLKGVVGGAIGFAVGGPGGAAAGYSIGAGIDAAGKQKKASKEQARIQAIEQRRQVIQQIREARTDRANVETNAANMGADLSSGPILGATGVASQLASNIDFLNTTGALSSDVSSLLGQAQAFQATGNLAFNIGQQYVTSHKVFAAADAAGIPKDQVSSGTIFDWF